MRHKINFSLLLSLVTWLAIFSVQTSAQELGDVDNLEQPDWLHSVTLKLENTDSDSADDTVESSTKVMGEREILRERFGLWYRWQNRERRSWNLQPKFSGWTSVGYHDQNNGLFNNHAHGINLHQLWMTIESSNVKEGDDQSVIGYRMDVVYGTDGPDTQAFGNPPGNWDYQNNWENGKNGWAMPQLYLHGDLGKIRYKLGHFFTPVGYETVTAPNNFFYSHAQTMFNSEPFTHTGVLTEFQTSQDATVYLGWSLGWDSGFAQSENGNNGIAGVAKNLTEDIALTYMSTFGNLGWRGEGYSHSIVLDMALTENLSYVLQSDYVNTSSLVDTGDDIGLNNYLIYRIDDCLSLGARLEWWRDNSVSKNSFTVGANWRPGKGLFLLRPEVRTDWIPADDYSETAFGVDAIVEF
ncbi:MAG: outer membrane beta-barrel protein [Planctomycetaceae bacterium]